VEAKDQIRTDVLVVGAGVAGLSCAITAKKEYPNLEVTVIDKAPASGMHNLSGAAVEPKPLNDLLNLTVKNWQQAPIVRDSLGRKVRREQMLFLSPHGKKNISAFVKSIRKLHFLPYEPSSKGCYMLSVTKLTRLLAIIAKNLGVKLIWDSPCDDVEFNSNGAVGVRLVDEKSNELVLLSDSHNNGQVIRANYIVLAEGCDGYVTEKFISRKGLKRNQTPLFAAGIKEVLGVSTNQYKALCEAGFIKILGYPFWRPFRNPSVCGFGMIYPQQDNKVVVTAVVSLNWRYCDFSPQSALALVKEHPYISRFVMGGEVVENGMKMLPQGGFNSIPFDIKKNTVGKDNVVIVGDGASFFSMKYNKGVGNAIRSGMSAGFAIGNSPNKLQFASHYTDTLHSNGFLTELKRTANYRQLSSRLGVESAMCFSWLSSILPFKPSLADSRYMTTAQYGYEPEKPLSRELFSKKASLAGKEGSSHLFIKDLDVCKWECMRTYDCPCLRFCPAGGFEKVLEHIQPKQTTKCFHCRICERKCPYGNISWTMPAAGSGPRYHSL
jgi:electron-transferring-flavoprotein dehydrogenase